MPREGVYFRQVACRYNWRYFCVLFPQHLMQFMSAEKDRSTSVDRHKPSLYFGLNKQAQEQKSEEPSPQGAGWTLSPTVEMIFKCLWWKMCSYSQSWIQIRCRFMCSVVSLCMHICMHEESRACEIREVCLLYYFTVLDVSGADGLVRETISWMAKRSLSRCRGLLMPISRWISVSDRADMMAPLFTLALQAATYHAGIPTHSW